MQESIIQKQKNLVIEFKEIDDWRERYRAIIEIGEELAPFPEEFRTDENLIKECQNKVWLASAFVDGCVIFYADGESQIVKGLAAILVSLYSYHNPSEILDTPADFIPELKLGENLTRNRSNGLAALVARIKQSALKYQLATKSK
jgi:cysteine desulfuration protein SufE